MHAYLDYNASAPLRDEARDVWINCQMQQFGNPNSTHYYGQQSRALFDKSRNDVATLLGCKGHELVLCGSGSEANALAIHAALQLRSGSIICSAIEHSSVLRNAAERAPTQLIQVNEHGIIDESHLRTLLTEPCALVCIQFANNELGCLQEVKALVELIKHEQAETLVLLDACQGAGKFPLALRELNVDFASIAGHKFGAPKGCGLLYGKLGLKIEALIHGGRQQQDRRSGTEDVAAMASMAAALQASLLHVDDELTRQEQLINECWAAINQALPQAVFLSQSAKRLPNTMCLAHPGVKNAALIPRLDLAGFCVSPGSACMAARGEASHVVAALGLDKDLAHSVVRVSIGHQTSKDEMNGFAQAYINEVQSLLAQ